MGNKKTYKKKSKSSEAKDPVVAYGNKRITFSTVETQNDIQLKYAMSISPIERLHLMKKLNDYVFKNNKIKKKLIANTRLIFTSYEYIWRRAFRDTKSFNQT